MLPLAGLAQLSDLQVEGNPIGDFDALMESKTFACTPYFTPEKVVKAKLPVYTVVDDAQVTLDTLVHLEDKLAPKRHAHIAAMQLFSSAKPTKALKVDALYPNLLHHTALRDYLDRYPLGSADSAEAATFRETQCMTDTAKEKISYYDLSAAFSDASNSPTEVHIYLVNSPMLVVRQAVYL